MYFCGEQNVSLGFFEKKENPLVYFLGLRVLCHRSAMKGIR
jgi:hypothetical protein